MKDFFTDPAQYARDLDAYRLEPHCTETRLMALSRVINQYPQVPRTFWIAVLDAWIAIDREA